MIKSINIFCKTYSICNNKSNQPEFREKLYFAEELNH